MSISIVIPVHNRIKHLEKSLLSLDKWQSYRDFDVIVSDDNSSDNFEELINNIREKVSFPITYTGYSYEDKPHLFRLSKARNEGCKLSDKDFLLIIDGDRILAKNYISDCLKTYNSIGHECVLGGRTIYLNIGPEEIDENREPYFYNNSKFIDTQDRCLCMFDSNGNKDITERDWANLYGGGVFIKRSFFEEIGGFNEDFEGYGHEDNDFALSIRRGDARIYLCYDLLMYHMHHDVYHTEYNVDEFYKAYGKQPFDFTQENYKRYRERLTAEEVADSRH